MQDLELEGLLRQLKLSDIRENCDDLVSEAIDTNEGYRDFLKRIFRYELEGRERRLSDKLQGSIIVRLWMKSSTASIPILIIRKSRNWERWDLSGEMKISSL